MKWFGKFLLIIVTDVQGPHKIFPFITGHSWQQNSESWKPHMRESPFTRVLHIFVVDISSMAHCSTVTKKLEVGFICKDNSNSFSLQSVSFC